jgi:hypothetical protein
VQEHVVLQLTTVGAVIRKTSIRSLAEEWPEGELANQCLVDLLDVRYREPLQPLLHHRAADS